MKNKEILRIFLITLAIFMGLSTFIYAQSDIESAEALMELDLFKGTENGFELEREPNRAETAVMLVRLLGIEQEVLKGNYSHPFNDVPNWADKHIGYLYENNITKGFSPNTFGSKNLATEKDYVTFVLRALSYSDDKGDFSWNNSIEFAETIGLISRGDTIFTRGSMVDISYRALEINIKDSQTTLLDRIIENKTNEEDPENVQGENNDYVYYINITDDSSFYNEDADSYKIFRQKDEIIEQISENYAFEFTILDDTIYFMMIDDLEREWGVVQRGTMWQVQTDGSNEKQVSDETIYSLTSDGTYIYYSIYLIDNVNYEYGYKIMRMAPGKEAEIFMSAKSYSLYSTGEWLYYVDNDDGNIVKRINTSTMKEEVLTDNPTIYEDGYMFYIYKNYLIMNTYYVDENYRTKNFVLILNMDTGEERTIVDRYLYIIDETGLLYFYEWETGEFTTVQFE